MRRRILRGTLFTLCLSFLGLVAGTLIGAWFVPSDSGLSGPAIALGYGILGMFISLLAGVVLSRKLSRNALWLALSISVTLTLMTMGWMAWRYHVTRADGEYPRLLNPVTMVSPGTAARP